MPLSKEQIAAAWSRFKKHVSDIRKRQISLVKGQSKKQDTDKIDDIRKQIENL